MIILCAGFFMFGFGAKASAAINDAYVRTNGSNTLCNGSVNVDYSAGVAPACAWSGIDYALTSSRVSQGGMITIQDGFNQTPVVKFTVLLAAGSGITTIKAETATTMANNTVSINIPSGMTNFLISSSKPLAWTNINFTNTNRVIGVSFFNVGLAAGTASQIFTDCLFDAGNVVFNFAVYDVPGNADNQIIRCKFTGWTNAAAVAVTIGTATVANPWSITIQSSLFEGVGALAASGTGAVGTVTLTNNTAVKTISPFFASSVDNTVKVFARNNLIQTGDFQNYGFRLQDGNYLCLGGNCSTAAYPYYDSDVFAFEGNVFHRTLDWDAGLSQTYSGSLVSSPTDAMIFYDPTKNFYIDPDWTDYAGGAYTMKNTSLASQRGVAGSLPALDINKEAWTGTSDVGCYKNPTATINEPALSTGTLAVVGDSIMHGLEGQSTLYTNTGATQVATLCAIPGSRLNSLSWLMDKAVFVSKADTIIVEMGVNNLNEVINPTEITNVQMATWIRDVFKKYDDLGINVRVIWMGIESVTGAGGVAPDNTRVIAVNDLVEGYCDTYGWECDSILNRMKAFNPNWQKLTGGYYSCLCGKDECTTGNVCTPNVHLNNYTPLINLASNLYLRKSDYVVNDTTGTATGLATYLDPITVAGLNATSAIPGNQSGKSIEFAGDYNLTIKPVVLNTLNHAQKITVNISTWETTGNHSKEWTESSDVLGETSTLHTVGDLEPNKYYNISVDDTLGLNIFSDSCTNGICQADSDGKIALTYTGGYSTHTFNITADTVAPSLTITSPTTAHLVSGDDTITFIDSETTAPQCSLNNTDWTTCTSGGTNISDLTGWNSINEGDTFTLYLKDTDASNNTGTTQTDNLEKADTIAPVRTGGAPIGELASGTTSTDISLKTNEEATCKYDTSSKDYADMSNTFDTTDNLTHTASIIGLTNGASYTCYIKCQDTALNTNDTDYLISFSVASPQENTDSNNDSNDNNKDDNNRNLNVHKVASSSTNNAITLTWKTDYNTKDTVSYGPDKNLKHKKQDQQKTKKHQLTIDNLLPNTTYYFKIKSKDGSDNQDTSKVYSIKTQLVETQFIASKNNQDTINQKDANNGEDAINRVSTGNACSYTVQSGDTLWSIAKKVYNDGSQYQKIMELNQGANTNTLKIGQELKTCDGNQASQGEVKNDTGVTTQNNPQDAINRVSTTPSETKTFQWWNPFSWF